MRSILVAYLSNRCEIYAGERSGGSCLVGFKHRAGNAAEVGYVAASYTVGTLGPSAAHAYLLHLTTVHYKLQRCELYCVKVVGLLPSRQLRLYCSRNLLPQ